MAKEQNLKTLESLLQDSAILANMDVDSMHLDAWQRLAVLLMSIDSC